MPQERLTEHLGADNRRPERAFLVIGLTIMLLGIVGAVAASVSGRKPGKVVQGVRVWDMDASGLDQKSLLAKLEERAQRFLESKATLTYEAGRFTASWFDLGLCIDTKSAVLAALKVGRSKDPWSDLVIRHRARKGVYGFRPVFSMDRARALRYLTSLKEKVDVKPINGRLDLRRRKVIPGKVGYALDVYTSMARILDAASEDRHEVPLAVAVVRPSLSEKVLSSLQQLKVMGWYETPYDTRSRFADREHNLRVAARKLNGLVIMPGETFSFNETIGARTELEGYRAAPVISAGELVDGMAGGMCQISSTLFAAAYFAGLEIVDADVHSQPSHYIELGLDATVVWPDKDLKLRNPYDFPVVIHYEVNLGRVRTEVLGRRRVYRIGFERRILAQKPYRELVRPDAQLEQGNRKVEQRGEFGYSVRRRRIFFDKEGNEIKSQYRTVIYPPTTMIVRMGTKPPLDPTQPLPELKPLQPRPVPDRFKRIIQ